MPRATLAMALVTAATAALGCTGMAGPQDGQSGSNPPGSTGPSGPGRPGSPGGGGSTPGGGNAPGGGGTTPMGGNGMTGGGPPMPPGAVDSGVSPLRRLTADQYRNTRARPAGPGRRRAGHRAAARRDHRRQVHQQRRAARAGRRPRPLRRRRRAAGAQGGGQPGHAGALRPGRGRRRLRHDASSSSFGRRAYRRPLEPIEIERLEKVYAAGGGFDNGIRLVIEARAAVAEVPLPDRAGAGRRLGQDRRPRRLVDGLAAVVLPVEQHARRRRCWTPPTRASWPAPTSWPPRPSG